MALALEALRRAAHDLHTCGSEAGREDAVAAARLIGELGVAISSVRADPTALERMTSTVEDWTA